MTQRERDILKASVSWTNKVLTVNEEKAFQAGAKWADDNPEWIRPIDEMPPIGVDVLTRVKRGSGDVIYQVDRCSEYEWVNLCHYDKVTHWMRIHYC